MLAGTAGPPPAHGGVGPDKGVHGVWLTPSPPKKRAAFSEFPIKAAQTL